MLRLSQSNPDIQNSAIELCIIIPAYRSLQNIFYGLTSFLILFIWIFYLKVPFFNPKEILSWTFVFISLGLGITLLLWTFFGKEELSIGSRDVKLKKTIFGLGRTKVFEIRKIKEFIGNYSSVNDISKGRAVLFGNGMGRIRFYDENKIHTLGLSLSPNQAERILQIINDRINVPS